jgi:hypothetical protein
MIQENGNKSRIITDFWRHIFGDSEGYLIVSTLIRETEEWKDKPFRYPSASGTAAKYALRQSELGKEVYFCVHLLTDKRRIKENATPIRTLWADVDGAAIPEDLPHPTAVVESSPGNYHLYYRTDSGLPPEEAEALNKQIAHAIDADPSGYDLSQVLRVPGTRNYKTGDAPEVRLTALSEETYSPADLAAAFPELPPESTNGHHTEADPDEPPVALTPDALRVWRGEDPKTKAEDSDEVDRSGTLLKIGRVLYDALANRAVIVEALRERDLTLGYEKYTNRRDADKQYAGIVNALEKEGRNPRIIVRGGGKDAGGEDIDSEEDKLRRASEAWETCEELAHREDITAEFANTLHSRGVAGESNQIRILYLTLVSRFLKKMVNIAVKGPSSSGKSYLVEQVVEAFPESAYYALTSMSEKALIYLDEDMRHRFLIIYEASGMAGDMQTYLIRTLLSEGEIKYQTAESTNKGVRPRLLHLEGPTGLIVTTTQTRMHPENETRLFSLNTTDSKEQTADILMAIANEDREPVSMDEWSALQTWLEGQTHEVTIHYARTLARLIPPVAVRLRRDFLAVLQLIKAHAILHQATRDKDEQGRIIATHEDYAVIYDLMHKLVSEGVDAAVNPNVRETVRAVAALVDDENAPENDDSIRYTTGKAVAKRLQLDKSAASRRIKAAMEAGYIQNLNPGKGRAQQLATAEQLPADLDILPKPADLQEKCKEDGNGCTVASESGRIQGCAVEKTDSGTETNVTSEECNSGDTDPYFPLNNCATVQPPENEERSYPKAPSENLLTRGTFLYPEAVTGDGERIVRWSENPEFDGGIHFGVAERIAPKAGLTPDEHKVLNAIPAYAWADHDTWSEAAEDRGVDYVAFFECAGRLIELGLVEANWTTDPAEVRVVWGGV